MEVCRQGDEDVSLIATNHLLPEEKQLDIRGDRFATTYNRSPPHNLSSCSSNGNHSADRIFKTQVFSSSITVKQSKTKIDPS
uniref:Uncharacterized protein n=1 Tax=Salix viminalis TaxID=40686 RepID=A0A6N2L2T0_SALVM